MTNRKSSDTLIKDITITRKVNMSLASNNVVQIRNYALKRDEERFEELVALINDQVLDMLSDMEEILSVNDFIVASDQFTTY